MQFLLAQESVLNHLQQSQTYFEIYLAFKLAITAQSSQVVFLLTRVFQDIVENFASSEYGFFERSFQSTCRESHRSSIILNQTSDISQADQSSLYMENVEDNESHISQID